MDNRQITFSQQLMQDSNERIIKAVAQYKADRDEWMRKARASEFASVRASRVSFARMNNRFAVRGSALL